MERKPEVRFREFDDDWEQRKLGQIYQKNIEKNSDLIGYDKTISIATMTYKNEGNGASDDSLASYKVLRMGDIAFEGHTNKQFRYGRFVVNDIGTGIMSPRFTTLRPKNQMPVTFWKYYIHYEPIMRGVLVNATKAGTMMNELVVPEFLEQSINVPSEKEQEQIGAYFTNLDSLIALYKRKYEKLLQIKKAMLAAMFPQERENAPRVRFREFSRAWEKVALGDLYQKNEERNSELIGYNKTFSIATMSYNEDGNGASPESLTNYKVLRLGDIAFEGHTNKIFRYGRFVLNDVGVGIMSPRFSTLRPIGEHPLSFWKYYIHHEPIMRRVLVNATKAGTMMNELVIEEFLKQLILVPSLPEQHRIGAFFQNLDRLIAVRQKKLTKLQNLKKALLQKMFV